MAARTRLPFRFPQNLVTNYKLVHTEATVQKEAVYPPIKPSLTAKSKSARARQIEEQIERIKASPLQDKLRLLTRIEREKYVVYPQTFARNADKWYQSFTKTAYIPGLPEKLSPVRPSAAGEEEKEGAPAPAAQDLTIDEETFGDIRSLVSRVILQEHWYLIKRKPFVYRRQELLEGPFLRNLFTSLTHALCKYNPVLLNSSLDLNPQVGYYWRRGERIIPRGHRKGSLEPTRFQIDDRPLCQLRITEPLPPLVPMEASYATDIPDVPYTPNLMPLFKRQYTNTIFTGSKFPDPACYGHTQFHLVPDRYHRDRMARRQQSDQVEVFLRANAITSLFAWTAAQASYQGFWNHEDVSRAFVSQAVITDGHFFSFFCYQLNTLALSTQTDVNNPRKNLLWGTESVRLYEGVEDERVVGLNDDAIRLLVRFFLQRPREDPLGGS